MGMKYSKLSMTAVAILGLSISTFAADSLEEAFKNGKVTGEIRAYYFDRDNGAKEENILATGLMLNYVTDSYNGFKIGTTFQSSSTPFASDEAKTLFIRDMWAQGSQLSEAYLAYTLAKTEAKAGRMYLSTPLIAGSGSRLVRESFEGFTLTNTDISDTTLGAVYVDKFQARTNRAGNIGQFKPYGDGVYSLYAINKSILGLTISVAWAQIEDFNTVLGTTLNTDLDIYNTEVIYTNKIGAFEYNLSGQYWFNKYSEASVGTTDDTIYGYGLKAGVSYAAVSGYIAYSKISDDAVAANQLLHGVGNGSDLIYTNSLISSYNYDPDMKAYAANLEYALTSDAKIGTLYTYTDTKNVEVSYTGLYASYSFNGALKGLSLIAQYEDLGKDKDGNEFRIKGSYKF
jgi:hypothetical protein